MAVEIMNDRKRLVPKLTQSLVAIELRYRQTCHRHADTIDEHYLPARVGAKKSSKGIVNSSTRICNQIHIHINIQWVKVNMKKTVGMNMQSEVAEKEEQVYLSALVHKVSTLIRVANYIK